MPDSHKELWVETPPESSEVPDSFLTSLAQSEGEEFGGKPEPKIDPILSRIAKEASITLLTGDPGTGKTTLAKELGKTDYDLVVHTDTGRWENGKFVIPDQTEKQRIREQRTRQILDAHKQGQNVLVEGMASGILNMPEVVQQADRGFIVRTSPSRLRRNMSSRAKERERSLQEEIEDIKPHTEKLRRTLPRFRNEVPNTEQIPYGYARRRLIKRAMKRAIVKKAAELKSDLLPQQRRVVRRMRKQPGLVVAHGTGQGKTLASIGAVVDLSPKNAKIYTPAPLRENYEKEIKKHVEGELPVKVESMQKLTRSGRAPRGDMIVIDEAHRIRNPSSKGYEIIERSKAPKRMLLTASPVYNRPEDIAPLVNLAAGNNKLPVGSEFRKRYVKEPSKGFLSVVNPWAQKEPMIVRKDELGGILRSWVDYEKGRTEGFPSLTERRINVPMSDRQSKLHDMSWGKLPITTRLRLAKGLPPDKSDLASINSFQTQARQIASSERKFTRARDAELTPKLRTAVKNLVKAERKDPQHRAVVYANFLDTLNDYSGELNKHKIPHGVFTGEQSKRDKDQMVRDFNDGRLKALLVSGAGAEGLDLKGTRQVQVLEPHWNEERVRQVIGRARRYRSHDHLPPSQRNVTVERYAAKPKRGLFGDRRGIDDVLYDMSDQKERLNRQVVELMENRR